MVRTPPACSRRTDPEHAGGVRTETMPDNPRIRSLGMLTAGAAVILVFSVAVPAQHRPRLKVPRELLAVLDQEDRDCVTQSGLDKSVTVQPIKLVAGKSQLILVRGAGLCLCGAQNCGFWIYRKAGRNYELILKGARATKVRPGPGSAKGYRDVISESHASANETILRTYRYDGTQYQPQRCINRAFYDDNGHYTTKPIDRPCAAEPQALTSVSLPASILDRDLTTIDHRRLKLSDYSGKTVVLNLFASWCGACRINLPDLIKLKQDYTAHPIEIVGLVSKKDDADADEVRKFVRDQGINFPVIWDTEDFGEQLRKLGGNFTELPQTFLIDRAGHMRKYFSGYNSKTTPQALRQLLDQIGAETDQSKTTP